MAAASAGVKPHIGPNGIYVSGSAKEEFGLAIVEAMGSGLAVIAPRVGGPATYIDHCFTGYLADTLDLEDIRAGIGWASGARHSEVRADAARRLVRNGYSLAAMAEELVASYHFENRKVPA
jgi:glycosyltransferase involved in cell wall biosynthesis